jgi:hypothetical protein
MTNFLTWLKNNDSFGVPIGMNYRGASQQKTYLGALVSIFFNLFMLYAAVMRFNKWWTRQSPKFSPLEIHVDLNGEGPKNIDDFNWNFAVGLYSIDEMEYKAIDPRLGKLVTGMIEFESLNFAEMNLST